MMAMVEMKFALLVADERMRCNSAGEHKATQQSVRVTRASSPSFTYKEDDNDVDDDDDGGNQHAADVETT